jgi:rubrerythrin
MKYTKRKGNARYAIYYCMVCKYSFTGRYHPCNDARCPACGMEIPVVVTEYISEI